MISTFYFLRQKEYKPVMALARILLQDKEDLMHKASGWMLRERPQELSRLCDRQTSERTRLNGPPHPGLDLLPKE